MAETITLTDVFNKLQEEGINAVIGENDETLLIWATSEGYTDIALALISSGANLDHQNKQGNTALIRSACEKRRKITNALIEAGADLDIQNNDGYSALLMAKRRDNIDIYKDLEKAGACHDLTTKDGKTVYTVGINRRKQKTPKRDMQLEQQIIEEIRLAA